MRRKLFLLLLTPLLFCGCDNNDDVISAGPTFYANFIQRYFDGDIELKMLQTYPHMNVEIEVYQTGFVVGFKDPALEYWVSDVEYNKLAERNGDTQFNQWVPDHKAISPRAFADNFGMLHIESNADWDNAHPAGTPLDDVLLVQFYSYAKFIRSGYNQGEDIEEVLDAKKYFNIIKKRISELTPADMEMLCWGGYKDFDKTTHSPIIIFTSAPTKAKEHTLTVEWTTVEGEVKTASLTCRPEVDPELQL